MDLITKSMKLLCVFHKSKSQGYGTIKLRVTIDKKVSVISTNIKTKKSDWRGNTKRFKNNALNAILTEIETDVKQLLKYMTVSKVPITAFTVTETYKKLTEQKLEATAENIVKVVLPKQKEYTVLELIDLLIQTKTNEVEESTLKTYKYKRAKVLQFLVENYGCFNFLVKNYNLPEHLQFIDFLKSLGFGKNHIARFNIFVKDAFKNALAKGYIKECDFLYHVEKKIDIQDLRHLELHQLEKLRTLNIADFINPEYDNLESLEIARDLFIFMCYTGFHQIDRLNLKDEDLIVYNENLWIVSKRQKTKNLYEVKLHPNALMIIEKYGGLSMLPKMQKDDFNVILKRLELMINVKIGLSTKIGRKTFAHISLNEWNIDMDTLAKVMGLRSARYVTAYGDITKKRIDKFYDYKIL
jgi:integrase